MKISKSDIKELSELKVEHRNWQTALEIAFSILTILCPGEVLFITGPSRAGKTKLKEILIELLSTGHDYSSTGYMPVVSTEAVNCSKNGSFSTKSFTKRLLNAVDHPIHGLPTIEEIHKQDRISEDTYRQALEQALKARKVKYLFIDEAQHVRFVSKDAQGAYAVMDSWKCLAQVSGVVLVVIGAYPILDIVRNSPHMIGRRHQIDLARYKLNREDLKEFSEILKQYGDIVGCTSLLMTNLEHMYKGSLGCIGLVRHWLIRAASLAVVRKSLITEDILMETMPTEDDLQSISDEITHGESLLGVEDSNIEQLNKEIKRRKKPSGKPFQRKADRISLDRRMGGEE